MGKFLMIAFFFAAILMTYTLYHLRAGLTAGGRMHVVGLEIESILTAVCAVFAVAVVFGPIYSIAFTLSVTLHEMGQVVAFRLIGHEDARFRLNPLFGRLSVSDKCPESRAEDFFVSLMGPGFSLAPMALAFALSAMTDHSFPFLSDCLWAFAATTGALNFLILLPFWPLDGGRCIRILVCTFLPRMAPVATIAMSGAFALTALWTRSLLLLVFALLGTRSIGEAEKVLRVQQPMGWRCGLLAGLAYLATAAAHLFVGWDLLKHYF